MTAGARVVITTRLPPRICGVGTYSWLVHKYWPSDSNLAQFIVMEGASESRSMLGYDAISDFHGDPKTLAQILDRSGATSILLHYAGRAYQRYGCPIWMPRVLRNWKTKFPNARLIVFFHEVPGEQSRLSRHFILGKINARIIRQLASVADVLITNASNHAAAIRMLSGKQLIHYLPVGSNIEVTGKSAQPRAESDFVLFGLPFNRLQTLQSFASQIREWQDRKLLTKLHLVGPEDEKLAKEMDSLARQFFPNIVRHEVLPATELSQLLMQARFALTNVTASNWSKSGVFMACAAHGCAVVTKAKWSHVPLCYTIAENEIGNISSEEIENRVTCLQKWFEENASWPLIAKRLASLCQT